jgi:23S rRNA (adenine2503-C2)-methyltransferase
LLRAEVAADQTRKLLLQTADGEVLESVVIVAPGRDRVTLCVSSQVGCGRRCAFCETGRLGLVRNLDAAEITAQFRLASALWEQERAELPSIRNIVFMGMGEPLDNLPAVAAATQLFTDTLAYGLSWRHITVSTVGVAWKLPEFFAHCRAHLAVSLNAPDDVRRRQIMPVNDRCSMPELKQALLHHLPAGRDVLVEYVLFADLNDQPADAALLLAWLQGLPVRLNLIPANPGPDPALRAPTPEAVWRFHKYLLDNGVRAMVRHPHGQELGGACGQLAGPLRELIRAGQPVPARPARAKIASLVSMLVLWLTCLLTVPAVANPPVQPGVSTAAKPAPAASPTFVRYDAYGPAPGLYTAIASYTRAGVTVDLVGAVHVADAQYYADLNRRFTHYNKVLYELIKPADMDMRTAGPADGSVSGLQRWVKDVLDLRFQLDAIDYTPRHFVHADMASEQLGQRMRAEVPGIMQSLLLWSVRDAARTQYANGSPRWPALELARALLDPNRARGYKKLLGRELAELDGSLFELGEAGKLLIAERNAVAMAVLHRQLSKRGKKPKRLAIFYGAAHLPDLAKRMQAAGFAPGPVQWLRAWDLR